MRTRILPLLITMLFALSLASNAAANENSKMTPGTIAVVNNPDSNDRLNLRTNPSPDAPTLGKYYNGTYLEVLSNEKNGWVKVSIFDLEGYMMAKFLVYPEQLEVGSSTVPSVKINNIGGTGLNLRKAQSTDSSSLGLYSNESTVRVFGVSETWCHVQTEDGNVGFMLREQLSPVLEYQKSSNSAVVNNPNSIGRLNLRTKPSQEAPSLGKYYSGTSVEVLSGDENGWTKVRFHTLEGYMMTKYLVFGQEQFKVGYAMPSVKINNTKGVGLNLRQDQSTNSPSLLADVGNGIKTNESNKNAMSRPTESPAEGRSHRGSWEFPEEGGQHSRFFSLLFRLKTEEKQCFSTRINEEDKHRVPEQKEPSADGAGAERSRWADGYVRGGRNRNADRQYLRVRRNECPVLHRLYDTGRRTADCQGSRD